MEYPREFEVQVTYEGEVIDTLIAMETRTQNYRNYLDSHSLIEVKNEGGSKEMYDRLSEAGDGVYKLELGYFSVGEYQLEVFGGRVLLTRIEKRDNKYKYKTQKECD